MRNRVRISVVGAALVVFALTLAACSDDVPDFDSELPDLGPSEITVAPTDPPEEDDATEDLPEIPTREPTEEPADTLTPTPAPVRVGDVEPDRDVVKRGSPDTDLAQLFNREDLHDGDALEIDNGGVANVLLDNGWAFLLFNKTRLGFELGEAETIQDVLVMQSGTLLGRRAIEECEGECVVDFPLPEGREIHIYGTTFFIILDESTSDVIVGNFDGGVEVVGGGVSMFVPPGTLIMEWGANQPPDQAIQGPIQFSPQDFEAWGYGLDAPVDFREVVCSDDSAYIADVTIPDGTRMEPGERFVKTWQLRNNGTCEWDAGYSLQLIDGPQIARVSSVPLDGSVEAGETLEISVEMVAPEDPGNYRAWWQLADEDGETFGQTPYVDIQVVDVVAPAPPTQISPKSNASLTDEGDCPPVQMAWSQPDDLSGISEYRVEIQVLFNNNWTPVEDKRHSTTSYTYDADVCESDPIRYAWRVAAVDGAGNASRFSDWDYFFVSAADTTPPPAPRLVSPADDAEFKGASCPSVSFAWEEPSDPSGIDQYEIVIDRWLGDTWSTELDTFTQRESYSFNPSFCTAITTYYRWRVRAFDNAGNRGSYSGYRYFTNNRVIQ